MENIFGIFLSFWKKNQCETVPEGGHEAGGAPAFPGCALDSRGHPIRRLMLFFGRKKAIFWKNIWAKVSVYSELRISEIKETMKGKNPGT